MSPKLKPSRSPHLTQSTLACKSRFHLSLLPLSLPSCFTPAFLTLFHVSRALCAGERKGACGKR